MRLLLSPTSFGLWEAAFTMMGLAFGIALTRVGRWHERSTHPGALLTLGVLLLAGGAAVVLALNAGGPVRTFAPLAMMVGLALTMVGLAGVRLSR